MTAASGLAVKEETRGNSCCSVTTPSTASFLSKLHANANFLPLLSRLKWPFLAATPHVNLFPGNNESFRKALNRYIDSGRAKSHFKRPPPKEQDLTTLPSRSAFLLTNCDGLPDILAHDCRGGASSLLLSRC